ncbi:MAG TPA: methylmalonyl Co-A mutase-associated GTPase MeaB [Kofleriaceae bacterium]|nr:methylmalonyl Co-A mutase-associated GTPase MeaB [Kofleriaceae bacterium]
MTDPAGDPDALAARIVAGDVRAAARLMRDLDDRRPAATAALGRLFPHTGRAHVVGVTGNPGAGKSTLVDALIAHFRAAGERVGVVCVDPSSPFSGGAILGDRVRMQRHALDPGVFIKSLATRGALGGLSRATLDVVHVLDAMGFARILIETVGVGQDELDVMRAAHTTVVVTVPGLGDDIQAIKSGLLEIADVLAVNKADRPDAARTERDLRHMLQLRPAGRGDVPVVRTIATRGTAGGAGIAELVAAIDGHRARGAGDPVARTAGQLADLVRARIVARVEHALARADLTPIATAIAARARDPWSAAEALADALWPPLPPGE